MGGSGEGVEAWEHGPDAAHPCAMLTMSTDPLATVDNFARASVLNTSVENSVGV